MFLKFLLNILIGAFIGYITNYLAIKMLFRPYRKIYIFGKIPVPFTPGVIPKERERIAEAIAETLDRYILSEEKLLKVLEENRYKEKIKERIDIIVDEIIDKFIEDLKYSITDNLSIGKFNLKTTLIVNTLDKALSKGLDKLKGKIKVKLVNSISEVVEKNIDKEIKEIPKNLNIKETTKKTLLEIDIRELEYIILGISEKQLKHITYFGAVIGAVIGFIQTFISSVF